MKVLGIACDISAENDQKWQLGIALVEYNPCKTDCAPQNMLLYSVNHNA